MLHLHKICGSTLIATCTARARLIFTVEYNFKAIAATAFAFAKGSAIIVDPAITYIQNECQVTPPLPSLPPKDEE
jgi:hypothetical protein